MVTNVTDLELLEQLRDSPEGRKLQQQREQSWLAGRRRLAEELGEVIDGLVANAPKLRDAEAKLAEQVRKAEERLQALRLSSGASEERQIRNRLEHRKTQLEGELLQTAPAEIDGFINELSAEWERVRARGIDVSPARRNLLGEMEGGESNAEAVRARMEGLREAQRQTESLKLAALTPEELRKRLDALRAAIPTVEA